MKKKFKTFIIFICLILITIVTYSCVYLVNMWYVLCYVAASTIFDMMLLDTSTENSTAHINPFAHFHFCNRYTV